MCDKILLDKRWYIRIIFLRLEVTIELPCLVRFINIHLKVTKIQNLVVPR